MEIDKLKLANRAKLFALFIYLIYFAIGNTISLASYLNINNFSRETDLKTKLLSSKCLFLLGGSNVRMGLSAEAVSIKSCESINLGISGEVREFQIYLNWLNNIMADKMIYSSALIWESSSYTKSIEKAELKFPQMSLLSLFKNILIYKDENLMMNFNKFGDQIEYVCNNPLASFKIKTDEFSKNNHLISKEIYNRISSLKETTNSVEVYLRVPPVFVATNAEVELYSKLMSHRIEILKGLGVKTIGSTVASSDRSLFCDSFHPNAKGREVFTKEILLP